MTQQNGTVFTSWLHDWRFVVAIILAAIAISAFMTRTEIINRDFMKSQLALTERNTRMDRVIERWDRNMLAICEKVQAKCLQLN